MKSTDRPRVAIVSRYSLFEQYRLAAEFKPMLSLLANEAEVLHLSAKGMHRATDVPSGVQVEELPIAIDRSSTWDILFKSICLYLLLPVMAFKARKFKPDVILFTEGIPFFGSLLKLFSGRRLAMHYGDRHLHYRFGHKAWSGPFLKLAEWIETGELRYVDGVFTRTKALADRMARCGVDPNRIRVVYDAPDLEAYTPRDSSELRASLGFKPDDLVLLYHGVMHPGKGLDQLVIWVGNLKKDMPEVGLIMVGSGPEAERLRQLAPFAHFTGWLKTIREVGDYCNAADICIAMRRGDDTNEAIIPGAMLHSMACRKIVIAPDMSAMREIIRHGENGYLFKPDDEEDFKHTIRTLSARRAEWGPIEQKAYETIIQNHSIASTARAYADAIFHFATL